MKNKQTNLINVIVGLIRILLAIGVLLFISLMFVLLGTATYKLIRIAMINVGNNVFWLWGIVVILALGVLCFRQYSREVGEEDVPDE